MQGSGPPSGGDQHAQAVCAALDLVCSSSEQTYAQFLSSFTQLNTGTLMSEEPGNILSAAPLEDTRDSRAADGHGDSGSCLRGRQDPLDLPELSNSLDKEAFRGEEEESRRDDLQVPSLLPGEVEREGLPAYTSSVIRSTQLEMSSTANATSPSASPSGQQQVELDEVQPFHLDENFDYDHVVLTHKYPTLQQYYTAS